MGFWSRKSSPPPSTQRENVKSKHKPAPKKVAPPPPKPKSKPKPKPKPKSRPRRIIIHFVRHAEVRVPPPPNPTFPKHPLLTTHPSGLQQPGHRRRRKPHRSPPDPRGKSQCLTLRTQFSHLNPRHILCSPLRRTLQTALLSLSPRTTIPITVDPELREYGSVPNCTGSSIAELKRKHEGVGIAVDFSRVKEGWERNGERDGGYIGGRWRRSREQRERSQRVLKRLWEVGREGLEAERERGSGRDVEILVISHGEFLHGLTGDYWHNADIISLTMIKSSRGYRFIDPPNRFAYH
ncbi:putative phosphoglycerate mutase protein [Botrytis fragariae]|uniref:Putative phosphoglycerate mutase protein n=1 Tax=Botrytis fragariae TaxID=1964551 RepID=A0A8H6B2H1_9HELO|nr:putative phosphoglycerate mutase protein [Botrytis fragariae]KAF5878136.1 putative phosphoglycerate mutase protein [Botrytis fragariae]